MIMIQKLLGKPHLKIAMVQLMLASFAAGSFGAITGPCDLRVSPNNRYIVHADGTPFFWLGCTAWKLACYLDRQEVVTYLENCRKHGFNVVQTVIISMFGDNNTNAYNDKRVTTANDPTTWAVTPGNNPDNAQEYDWWDHLDYIVDEANARDIYIALIPCWGYHLSSQKADKLEEYGRMLGERYKNKGVIWIMGGDISDGGLLDKWRTLARGIAKGYNDGVENYDNNFMTYSPAGPGQTRDLFTGDEKWLDLGASQTGHCINRQIYDFAKKGWNYTPAKPHFDIENWYENLQTWCSGFDDGRFPRSTPSAVRCNAYWSTFWGACSHVYGNGSLWCFADLTKGRKRWDGAEYDWKDPAVLDAEARADMKHVRALFESRPFLSRVPDHKEEILASAADYSGLYTSQPTINKVVVTYDSAGSYIMVFTPTGSTSAKPINVKMDKIKCSEGNMVKAWWYDPREGKAIEIGSFENTGVRAFVSPSYSEKAVDGKEWILVLDDASKNYPPPGVPILKRQTASAPAARVAASNTAVKTRTSIIYSAGMAPEVTFMFTSGTAPARLRIFDSHGRVLREDRILERDGGGRFLYRWDGRTCDGRQCTPGVYQVIAVTEQDNLSRQSNR